MNNPHKIIHIIIGLEIGGAEQMLKRLIVSDPQAKERVVVISLSGLGTIGEYLRSLGYTVHVLNFLDMPSLPANFWALIKLLKANKPTVIQTWMYHADLLGGIAARMAGCRHIVWGIRNTCVPQNSRMTYLIMRVCALLSHWVPEKIICVAEAAKNKHCIYGYQAKKMVVIPNGFDFTRFDAQHMNRAKIRYDLGLGCHDFIIGCVGRLHLDKGQDVFIKAVALLGKTQKQTLRFVLIGRECDNNNAKLLQQIDSLGLSSSFILLGERQDIPECLVAMDVFCMPSRTEGFPNGLGEAMCMGLPCVATRVGDAELLAGDTAVMVAADDPVALASGLTQIIEMSEAQRQLLGQKAAMRVREHFSIDKARERFYALYQDITESSH